MSGAGRDGIAEAIASEEQIAEEALKLREGHEGEFDGALLDKLTALLRKPIPGAFIQAVGKIEGKPYASTGVRSVQVQVDRMNNVLGLANWWFDEEFSNDGKVCKVTVYVGAMGQPLLWRSSHGGVDRGSGTGNRYKGSFTNAAKLAFARVGPGHEIYIDAADLDPDVNEEVAKQVGGGALSQAAAQALAARAFRIEDAKANLKAAAEHLAEVSIGDCSTLAGAAKALTALTFEQAERLDSWLKRKETEAGVDGTELASDVVENLVKGYELAKPVLAESGVNALDGLNLRLGALGVDAFDPNTPIAQQFAALTEEQASALDVELQKLVEQEDGEPGAD